MKHHRILGFGITLTLALGLLVAIGLLPHNVSAAYMEDSVPASGKMAPALPEDIVLTHTLSIEPASNEVILGEEFTVNVVISDVQDLGALEYTLEYIPSVVQATNVQLGDFPASTGRTVVGVGPIIDNGTGTLDHGFFSLGIDPGPDGTGIIASITFTTTGEGSSALDLTAAQTTDTGANVLTPTILIDGSVNVVVLGAGVELSPGQASNEDPGATIAYAHVLTNTGNIADTFSLSTISSQGWTVNQSPNPTLEADASTTVYVTVTVPSGASAGTVDETTLTAVSQFDAGVSTSVMDTTTVNQVAEVSISPNRQDTANPGETITYEHLLTNLGNGTDTFTLSAFSLQGWTVSHSPNQTLASGASATVYLTVTVPADAQAGVVDEATLSAVSQFDSGISGAVIDITTVNQIAGVSLSPDQQDTANPGETIGYAHVLTNTGNGTDTITLSAISSLGWTVTPSPNPTLVSGASATVYLTVTVPADAMAGTVDETTLTATSQFDIGVSAAVVDATTVNQVADVSLSPDRQDTADPGETITYVHLLINTGNGTDTFTLSANSSQGWTVSHSPNPTLASGASATAYVTVTVPSDVSAGTMDETTLSADSQFDGGVSASVLDTTTVNQIAGVSLSAGQQDTAAPGEAIAYAHVLTNTGNGTDTFSLSAISSEGWTVSHSPNPTLASGASATVYLTVTVPTDAMAGTVDETTLTAASQADAGVSASVLDTTTVNQVAGVSLSQGQQDTAKPGETIVYAHVLTNTGNGTDTFTLSVVSSQGWTVTHSSDPTLAGGASATVYVTVTVPANAGDGTIDEATLSAVSQYDTGVSADVTDTTTVHEFYDMFMPVILNGSGESTEMADIKLWRNQLQLLRTSDAKGVAHEVCTVFTRAIAMPRILYQLIRIGCGAIAL
jgi:uncharacterized membrane protein